MIFGILIVFFSIILLIVIHELGHFLMAKKFGVKVEEFGIGIPPRIFGKKIGETIYSLNWIPIGAFVKIYGEDEKIKDSRSFSEKAIWQRFLIIAAGVISFWLVAFVLLTIMAGVMGVQTIVDDQDVVNNARVFISDLQEGSVAQQAGLREFDIIKRIEGEEIEKTSQVKEIIKNYDGVSLSFLIERETKTKEINLFLGEDWEQGSLVGIGMNRIGRVRQKWFEAPVTGLLVTERTTRTIVTTLSSLAYGFVTRQPIPEGVDFMGPIGIGKVAFNFLERGIADYLDLIVLISISLAIFNLLPIPALDGGRLLFLIIEKIKGKPINESLERKLIGISFALLLGLFVVVTFRDILQTEIISNFIEKLK